MGVCEGAVEAGGGTLDSASPDEEAEHPLTPMAVATTRTAIDRTLFLKGDIPDKLGRELIERNLSE